jgi:penicillin-binding protein 1A
MLRAAVNRGTGRAARLPQANYGKTGTTQDTRDALFFGFAGNRVVGVWIGRDDNGSLGKVSGGTVPAQIWRSFMTSALAIDDDRGPDLPAAFGPRKQRQPKSPLPPEWSDSTKPLRDIAERLREIFGSSRR